MRKQAFFDHLWGEGWPDPEHVESCLLDPKKRESMFALGQDGGSFIVEGLYETGRLTRTSGRVDVVLYMVTHPKHRVFLHYQKWDGRTQQRTGYLSKGDLRRLKEYVTIRSNPMPIGFFISFEAGCSALKEFLAKDGELPGSIEWVSEDDVAPNTFPGPPKPSDRKPNQK